MTKKLLSILGVLIVMGAGCARQEVGVPVDQMEQKDTSGAEMMEGEVMMGQDETSMMNDEGGRMMEEPAAQDSAETVSVANPVVEEAPGVKSVAISAKRYEFSPSVITVNQGDKVTFTLTATDVSHGITLPEFGVNITAGAGETVSTEFVADQAGTFTFRCNVYCGTGHTTMTGTLIVQ